MSDRGVLQRKDFRILFSGQIVAVLGDWFGIIAILALVGFRWQATPMEMSIVLFVMAAPMLFLGPVSGVIVDRVDRGLAMIVIDLLRAVVVFFVAVTQTYWTLVGLLFILGALDASFMPAKNAKLKELAPPEQLGDAVIYSSFIDQGARIVGPALGGTAVALFSVETALYINAIAYVVSAIIIYFLPKSTYKKSEEKENFVREFKDGINVAKAIPFMIFGTLIQVYVVFTVQIVDSQFVILLRTLEYASESWVGYCLMASGIGTVLTAFIYLKRHQDLDVKGSMFAGMLIFSCSIIGIGLWGWLGSVPIGFIPFFLLWGASGALIFVKFITYAQERIPEEFSGRVIGSMASMLSGASMLGLLAGGILVSTFGAINTFIFAGAFMLLGALWLGFRIYVCQH